MLYEEMRLKKTGETVRVYDITDGVATIFDPSLYQRQNNGWAKVKASQVVPMDFPLNSKDYVSKTKKNKAKARMQLLDATWRTTDGWMLNKEVASALGKNPTIIPKPTFGSLYLAEYIREHNFDRIEFIGLCTDICVVSNVLLAKAYLPEASIAVDASCCAGVTPESHNAAIQTMKMCQIEIVGE